MTTELNDRVESPTAAQDAHSPFMPPRWFVRTAWLAHRALYRGTGGRRGLWPPKPGKWGTMRLLTVGRKTGKEREAIVAYFEDGPNIITMAMNGWGEGEPAWWLNLLDHPNAQIEINGEGGTRAVRSRPALGEERDRLWESWRSYTPHLDDYAALRSTDAAVVVLEPRSIDPSDAAA